MPLISSFFGVLIYMYKEKNSPHNKPHVHAVYAGEKLSIASNGEILAGCLPRKQQKYVEVGLPDDSQYKYISLLPLTTKVTGITLKGFKYLLENGTLKIGESIGVSNEQIEEEAIIEVKKGILVVIKSKD